MNGLEAKLAIKAAGEVAKPLGGIFDALFGHKIEGLKKWAIDKDVERYAADENVSKLLEIYISRTVSKVSNLSTIVFPQSKVAIKDVYEDIVAFEISSPKDFSRGQGHKNHIFDLSVVGATYLITDVAGMGKSTFVKNLCLEILKENVQVPIFFELSEIDPSLSLVDNLAKNFDGLDKIFDRDLFRKLISKGKFFVILDGFDEIAVDSQKWAILEIEGFNRKKGNNSLVVTSRPQEAAPILDNAVRLGLKTLDKRQVISILNKYDNFSGMDIGRRLQKEFERIPDKFLATPLLVGLLYRTYGFSNSIAQKISVFYSEIFDALYKGHDLTKSGFVREKVSGLDVDEFRKFFRSFCFFYIFKISAASQSMDYFVSLASEAKKVCSTKDFLPRKFIDDLLVAVPLLAKDGLLLKFMHRSIAEFFAAEYIAYSPNVETIMKGISSRDYGDLFNETVEYIFEIAPEKYQKYISIPIARKFVEFSDGEGRCALVDTMSFIGDWNFSIYIVSEVERKDSDGISDYDILCDESWISYASQYNFGSVNGVEYLAVISSQHRLVINNNAWLELSEPVEAGLLNSKASAVDTDSIFSELVNNFEINKLYDSESSSVSKFGNTYGFKWLLSNFISNDKKGGLSARELSREKCQDLINRVDRFSKAEENLLRMLGSD